MPSWAVSCRDCQEPVGEPWWPNGCACDGELTDDQRFILRVLNLMWDLMRKAAMHGNPDYPQPADETILAQDPGDEG